MAIDRRRRLDPVDLQGQSKYQEQGITRISNNDSVVKRDSAGNIELQENKTNPLLIIEPIYKKVLNSSVVKVLDTQFNYFKFPVRVTGESINLDLDIDLNFETDNISANLTIPIPLDSNQQPQNTQKISTTFDSTWYYGDNAPNSKGYRELPFVGGTQPNANGYTITKEILESLKQKNKTIRFKFAVQYRTSANSRTNFNTRLTRSNRKTYNPLTLIFNKQQNVTGGSEGDANPYGFTVPSNSASDYPYLVVTYIVNLDDTKADDVYKLSAVSGNAGVILAQNSYWDVDIVDIPDTTNEIYENVYSINDDTAILTGDNQLVVLKSSENNQVATLV